jgi:hypothetical protein
MASPLQQGQHCQLNNSKDACALIMAMTLCHELQRQQCQRNDYASSTTAETPSQQGQQSPLQQRQGRLCNNGNNAIATRATTPL